MQNSKRNVHWLRASVVVAIVGTAASAQPLVNPSFDDVAGGSTNGWFSFGNVFISNASSDNIFQSPDAAVKVFGDFSGGFNVAGLGQAFTAIPGSLYEMDAFSFISSGDLIGAEANECNSNRAILKISFFDAPAGGNELASNEVVIGDSDTAPDVWNLHTVSALAPSGAVRVEALILYLQPTGAGGGAVFVDDCDFREVGPPAVAPNILVNGDFGDGTLNGWMTFGNAFAELNPPQVRTPPAAAFLFGNFDGGFNVSGMFQEFPASEGTVWNMDLFAMRKCVFNDFIMADETMTGDGPPNDNWAVAKIAFFDGGATEIGAAEAIIASGQTPLGTWTPYSVNAVAPAGTVSVQALVLYLQPMFDGGAAFVDDITFAVEAFCGDGNVDPGEQCDDGANVDGDGCNANCVTEFCGDGTVNNNGTEACDDGGESAACDADCTVAECGDGNTNDAAGEDCDDAGASATCDADCSDAVCGDGTLNQFAGEECDDGNNNDGDSCNADCTIPDVAPIPTISGWAMLVLMVLLAMGIGIKTRRSANA